MTGKQKIVLLITAGILVLMLLFPPFHLETDPDINLGYSFILDPPLIDNRVKGTVNVGTLLSQVIIVTVAGVLFCYALKEKEIKAPKNIEAKNQRLLFAILKELKKQRSMEGRNEE